MGLFPASPADAARAALKIRQAVHEPAQTDESLARLDVGLGIHTGSTMLGTVGDADRMEATVLSDAVNLAARLEGLTRAFGVGILISEITLSLIAEPDELAPARSGESGYGASGSRSSCMSFWPAIPQASAPTSRPRLRVFWPLSRSSNRRLRHRPSRVLRAC